MHKSMMVSTFFSFRQKILFSENFGPDYQNCQLKLKFGTWTNLNVQNSSVIFIFSFQEQTHLFWQGLSKKAKLLL